MMYIYKHYRILFLLVMLAFTVQGCMGIGDSNNGDFKQVNTGNGHSLNVNQSDQALFKGNIYFTQNHNLFVLDGSRNIKQLTNGKDVRDPAISPDGKWIAFISRSYYSSDLILMPTTGGAWKTVVSGDGKFIPNPGFAPKSTHNWIAQPSWSSDGKSLLFLSDLQKLYDWANHGLGNDFDQSPFLDLQVFTVSAFNPAPKDQIEHSGIVAYASYGDGGNQDPSYRPGHPDQIIYTHYSYDASRTNQMIQLFMEDPKAIIDHPEMNYHPGDPGQGFDPGIAITPSNVQCLQPAFSPDGNSIAYIQRIDPTHMGLYVMPVPPNNITKDPNNPAVEKTALTAYTKNSMIVSGQFVSQPVWSPDGKQIAYLSYNNNAFDIWLANVSLNKKTGTYTMQGSPVQLTNGGIDGDSRPFWTA